MSSSRVIEDFSDNVDRVKQNERLNRALKQRMYLLEVFKNNDKDWSFVVEGFSGNNYGLIFAEKGMSCGCPDFKQRGRICKHMYFILGRVFINKTILNALKMKANVNIYDYSEYFEGQIETFLNKTNDTTDKIKKKIKIKDDEKEKEKDNDEDKEPCSICFEEFGNELVYDCEVCKKQIHKECMDRWLKHNKSCVLCRSPWNMKRNKDIIESDDIMRKFKKQKS